jgi:putative ABC transport system permease protein
MTLPLIIYRSLRQHSLSTLVTSACVALASGLLMTVWMVRVQSQRAFAQNSLSESPAHDRAADFLITISWFDRVLMLVALIVVLVAVGSVLASVYASMSARQRDIAILRALGAKRGTIFSAVIFEAMAIGALGAFGGFAVYAVLMTAASEIIHEQTGVAIPVAWSQVLLWAPLSMMALGALGGLAPAAKAYRVPVAQTLSPLS